MGVFMLKLVILIIYFAVLIGIGLYCRKHATDVNGFVLGGRSVGPWLTAFAYGTSYFSAVVFVEYAGQFGWKYGIAAGDEGGRVLGEHRQLCGWQRRQQLRRRGMGDYQHRRGLGRQD